MEEQDEHDEDGGPFGRTGADLIGTLHSVHIDNARLLYFARGPHGRVVPQMPLTPFIYEFFLFNSLYQIDWASSRIQQDLVFHGQEIREAQKQKRFIDFLRDHARKHPEHLHRAFEPICDITDLDGLWTRVDADSRISQSDGSKFFACIQEIQNLLNSSPNPAELSISNNEPNLDDCARYINKVRNNIFHGSKTLGDAASPNQKLRIEVYEMFLKGLTSLFFLAVGKEQAACDIVPCEVPFYEPPLGARRAVASREMVLEWTAKELMKVGDSRLIARFRRLAAPPTTLVPDASTAMFYPSAGKDILTPLLLSLPYCTKFYFYESNQLTPPSRVREALREFASPPQGQERLEWMDAGVRRILNFVVGGIPRTIYWSHSDNTQFLTEAVSLRFYFHRGDSEGEGGSGQQWDSELLPKLLLKIPAGESCLYVTDGMPGGFSKEHTSESFALNLPFVERGRTYYCGRFL